MDEDGQDEDENVQEENEDGEDEDEDVPSHCDIQLVSQILLIWKAVIYMNTLRSVPN